jgi:hypothetical protein
MVVTTTQTMDDMPSSYLGHLSHLGYLSTLSNLNILNPYTLDTIPTDSPLKAFITELDPKDPGPSKGYYEDDSLNPIPIATPLLPTTPPSGGRTHIRQIDAWMGMT